MKKSLFSGAATFAIAVSGFNAYADQESSGMDVRGMKMELQEQTALDAMPMSDGEVEAVDKEGKTITLKHGPISSKTVKMSPMSMTFYVQDPSVLSNVKVGDKVKFTVEYVDSALIITSMTVAK